MLMTLSLAPPTTASAFPRAVVVKLCVFLPGEGGEALNLQDQKTTDQIAGLENAGHGH